MNCLSSFHLLSFIKRNWCLDDSFLVWLCPKMIYFQKNFHRNRLDMKESFLAEWAGKHWNGKWRICHPWKCSKALWMCSWGSGLVVTTTMISEGFSNLNRSLILLV